MPVGNNVVVIGGGLVGIESAMQLAEEGKRVTVVEMQDEAAVTAARGGVGFPAVKRALDAGVEILYQTSVEGIEDGSVLIRDAYGAASELAAETVLLAAGVRPRKDLTEELRHTIAEGEVYIVGDLRGDGGSIGHATNTAFDVAVVI